jgi:hypothetical protein
VQAVAARGARGDGGLPMWEALVAGEASVKSTVTEKWL